MEDIQRPPECDPDELDEPRLIPRCAATIQVAVANRGNRFRTLDAAHVLLSHLARCTVLPSSRCWGDEIAHADNHFRSGSRQCRRVRRANCPARPSVVCNHSTVAASPHHSSGRFCGQGNRDSESLETAIVRVQDVWRGKYVPKIAEVDNDSPEDFRSFRQGVTYLFVPWSVSLASPYQDNSCSATRRITWPAASCDWSRRRASRPATVLCSAAR
jgi:hypothetical protein